LFGHGVPLWNRHFRFIETQKKLLKIFGGTEELPMAGGIYCRKASICEDVNVAQGWRQVKIVLIQIVI
jgi:hypothetical protein